MDLNIIFYLVSVQCIITAIFILYMARREKKREKREENRARSSAYLVQSINASLTLSEATAKSVQRLDKECNGEMTAALEYAKGIKLNHRDFLIKQGIEYLQL